MLNVPVPTEYKFDYCKPINSPGRVMLGARWLDKHLPGWEYEIDLSTLDILDNCNCICGQLFISYVRVIRIVETILHKQTQVSHQASLELAASAWMSDHGFVNEEDTEAWIALIKSRFDTGALSA